MSSKFDKVLKEVRQAFAVARAGGLRSRRVVRDQSPSPDEAQPQIDRLTARCATLEARCQRARMLIGATEDESLSDACSRVVMECDGLRARVRRIVQLESTAIEDRDAARRERDELRARVEEMSGVAGDLKRTERERDDLHSRVKELKGDENGKVSVKATLVDDLINYIKRSERDRYDLRSKIDSLTHECDRQLNVEVERLRAVLNAANEALFDSRIDDVEHQIHSHADTLPDVLRRVAGGHAKALEILQGPILEQLEAMESRAERAGGGK